MAHLHGHSPKDVFRLIQADRGNLHGGWILLPVGAGAAAIHPICFGGKAGLDQEAGFV